MISCYMYYPLLDCTFYLVNFCLWILEEDLRLLRIHENIFYAEALYTIDKRACIVYCVMVASLVGSSFCRFLYGFWPILWMFILFLLSYDLELNPGPVHFPCSVCLQASSC